MLLPAHILGRGALCKGVWISAPRPGPSSRSPLATGSIVTAIHQIAAHDARGRRSRPSPLATDSAATTRLQLFAGRRGRSRAGSPPPAAVDLAHQIAAACGSRGEIAVPVVGVGGEFAAAAAAAAIAAGRAGLAGGRAGGGRRSLAGPAAPAPRCRDRSPWSWWSAMSPIAAAMACGLAARSSRWRCQHTIVATRLGVSRMAAWRPRA
jgi:hypothetical protein